ncbi:hypothetical protein [Salinivibrio sp. ML198]|uniref:hypothetical protein n=1 Tax=Salinivibrio sp. ML198 TaxID=1909458 RepID=UPI0027394899|nr:hypothetical protein [Salinivibrio sp. ML198]
MLRLPHLATACVIAFSISSQAHTLMANHVQTRPETSLENVGINSQLVTEEDLTFRPRQYPLDINAFLGSHLPHWQPVSEAVMHWSGASGIDPRIVITTLITNEPALAQNIALDRISKLKLLEDIKQTAATLSSLLYQSQKPTTQMAHHATQVLVSALNTPSDWQAWKAHYQAWFSDQKPLGSCSGRGVKDMLGFQMVHMPTRVQAIHFHPSTSHTIGLAGAGQPTVSQPHMTAMSLCYLAANYGSRTIMVGQPIITTWMGFK